MKFHLKGRARFYLHMLRSHIHRSRRDDSGRKIELSAPSRISLAPDVLDVLQQGLLFWSDPSRRIENVPVVVNPDLERAFVVYYPDREEGLRVPL